MGSLIGSRLVTLFVYFTEIFRLRQVVKIWSIEAERYG